MIKKDVYYNYDDIKKILEEAQAKAMLNMEKNMEEAMKESTKSQNPMGRVAFTMQNLIAMHELISVILGRGE